MIIDINYQVRKSDKSDIDYQNPKPNQELFAGSFLLKRKMYKYYFTIRTNCILILINNDSITKLNKIEFPYDSISIKNYNPKDKHRELIGYRRRN